MGTTVPYPEYGAEGWQEGKGLAHLLANPQESIALGNG